MGEKVGQIAKVPEIKQPNSNSRVRRTKRLQSMDTPADRILFLQRTAGNQAVSRLMKSRTLQAKLRIGQPNDRYEQEADLAADQVLRTAEPQVQRQVKGDVPTFALANGSRFHPRHTCGNYTDAVSP